SIPSRCPPRAIDALGGARTRGSLTGQRVWAHAIARRRANGLTVHLMTTLGQCPGTVIVRFLHDGVCLRGQGGQTINSGACAGGG
ncbi:MAG: hypothetical protein M3325_15375, partial [Actinomycetota bacterium]|nr:hypothetical protein [Actinomycetota bacterium]